MQAIQNDAIATYLENIEFLKNNHNSLYQRVDMLSLAIESNQYKERYHLEYIQEDKEFDIFDEHTQTYIYDKQPKKFINTAVANSNLDKHNSIDLLDPRIYNRTKPFNINEQKTMESKTLAKVHNDIFEYTNIFKKSTIREDKRFLEIEKFIFVGTLLGRHIEPIVIKLKTMLLLIYEKNLEIFRLSLFTTNYAKISSENNIFCIFSIMEEEKEEFKKFKKFFSYEVYSNHMLKYYSTNYNIGNFFDTLLSVIKTQTPFSFTYETMIDYLISPASSNISNYPILDTKFNHTLLQDTPVLFVAAGPSLGRNIEWIKKYKNRYTIVAVGAAVSKLIASDIIPDLITSADGDEIIAKQFPLEIREKIQNIPFLASTSTSSKVLKIFPKNNIILYELMCLFKKESEVIQGYSVGEITLKLLSILGANHIYMLGTDMALDQETGASHIADHDLGTTHTLDENKKEANYFMKNNEFQMKETSLAIKGNLRETVITTTSFINSINAYKYNMQIILQQNPNIRIYNLCDGAYLEGTTPLKIDDIAIPNKNKKELHIQEKLLSHSTMELNAKDIKNIQECITIVNTLLNKLKKLKKLKLKSYQEFKEKREQILTIIHQRFSPYANLYAGIIFNRYYLTMEAYLGFQFNEKLSNEKELINQTKEIWCDQLLRLALSYQSYILQLVKI